MIDQTPLPTIAHLSRVDTVMSVREGDRTTNDRQRSVSGDEGGEPPCFAHLFEETEPLSPRILDRLLTERSDDLVSDDGEDDAE